MWAHLPVILNPNGQGKMSKREIVMPDGVVVPVYAHSYRQLGYLPDAMFNFLCGIGWALDGATDIYDRETAVDAFGIDGIQASPSALPAEKLAWMNGVYIRKLTLDALLENILPYMSQAYGLSEGELRQDARLRLVLGELQERIKKLSDAPEYVDFLYRAPVLSDPAALIPAKTTPEQATLGLTSAAAALAQLDPWHEASIEEGLRHLAEELHLKPGQLFSPIRVAVTGKTVAPPLFVTLAAIGQEESVARLRRAVALLEVSAA